MPSSSASKPKGLSESLARSMGTAIDFLGSIGFSLNWSKTFQDICQYASSQGEAFINNLHF